MFSIFIALRNVSPLNVFSAVVTVVKKKRRRYMFISKSIKSYSYKYICKQKIEMGWVFILNYVSVVQ